MKIKQIGNLFLTVALIASCTLDPRYKKPEANLPFKESDGSKEQISQISWQDFFTSEDLQRVVKLALKNNPDLKIANANIEKAEAIHDVSRSNLFPTINATAYETKQGVPGAFASFTPRRQFRANVSFASYEVDFFGRLRSLKRGALESFLASEEARQVTKVSVITQTVNAYAQLLMDREILKISEENFAAQSEKFKFSELRYKTGLDSQTQLLAAQAAIETARITRDSYIKIVEQDKNALMALTGVFDEKFIPQNTSLDDIKIAEDLLEFVPSEALLLRPDIRQAEHSLKSSNANIGAARAAFFPSITLSGTYGYGSRDLNTLLDSRTWTFTPQINLPIFTGGRNLANLDSANADKKIQIGNYEKVIQNAFREALDQFVQREAISKQLKSYDKIFAARNKFYNLSQSKHKVGSSSANELLDAKISMLAAKQSNITAKKEYIANLITLYKVLGGGSDVGDEEDDCK